MAHLNTFIYVIVPISYKREDWYSCDRIKTIHLSATQGLAVFTIVCRQCWHLLIMPETIASFHFEAGTKAPYTDHVTVRTIVRPDGDRLSVAVVADGGAADGQVAKQVAQVAVNSTLTYLKYGAETEIVELLTQAVRSANRTVQVFASSHEPAVLRAGAKPLCTLAIALFHNDETLYIANVGDSRIYFLREGRLTQLTLDHTFKNLHVTFGKMNLETASANPNADVSIRSLGSEGELPIDIGFHIKPALNQRSYARAHSRGKKGLPLKAGDKVLVCSDGLIKNRPKSVKEPSSFLIKDEEMIQLLSSQEGEKAIKELVKFSLGRNAADSVSAAILQIPDVDQVVVPVNRPANLRDYTALSSILSALMIS